MKQKTKYVGMTVKEYIEQALKDYNNITDMQFTVLKK